MKKINSEGYGIRDTVYGIRTTVYGRRYTDDGKGFTLIELLIALSLVGLIILAIVAVDVGSRGFLKSTDQESKLQNDVNYVLGTIAKDISRSYRGTKSKPSIKNPSSNRIEVRLCKACTGLSDSKWVVYEFKSAAKNIEKKECDSDSVGAITTACASKPALAGNIVNCAFSLSADNLAGISITARADASQPKGQDNSEVVLETSVYSYNSLQ